MKKLFIILVLLLDFAYGNAQKKDSSFKRPVVSGFTDEDRADQQHKPRILFPDVPVVQTVITTDGQDFLGLHNTDAGQYLQGFLEGYASAYLKKKKVRKDTSSRYVVAPLESGAYIIMSKDTAKDKKIFVVKPSAYYFVISRRGLMSRWNDDKVDSTTLSLVQNQPAKLIKKLLLNKNQ